MMSLKTLKNNNTLKRGKNKKLKTYDRIYTMQ